jgi:hypothetical protein
VERERVNVVVQTYNLGGPAVKKSDLKYVLAKLVIMIEQFTWKKLEVDGYIVQKGDSTWVKYDIYKFLCFFFILS